jgi:hypothetical protein
MLVRARKVHEVTAENRPSRRDGFVVAAIDDEPGRAPRLAYVGLATKLPEWAKSIRLREARVRVGVKYFTFPWPKQREYVSSSWAYSAMANKWYQVLPQYR